MDMDMEMEMEMEMEYVLNKPNRANIIQALKQTLGSDCVIESNDINERNFIGYGSKVGIRPVALLRPNTVEQVSLALAICYAHTQSVVPQGGMTGLAGGATPRKEDVVLSLERLTGIEQLDVVAGTITVKAGTPLQHIQEAAERSGLMLGLDLGARGSCQIGGNIATNAGGNRVIRFGMAREQVLGLEVVLANGTIVSSMNTMIKNNAGYDIKHLFIGTEGTLGIITRAVLRLLPQLRHTVTALCVCDDFNSVIKLLLKSQADLANLTSFEVMWPEFYRFVVDHTPGINAPFLPENKFFIIVECASHGGTQHLERFTEVLESWFEDGIICNAIPAQSMQEAQQFWTIREGLEIDNLPNLINFDVSIPLGKIEMFATSCREELLRRWPGAINLFFGHVGDSNIHLCVSVTYGPDESEHDVDLLVYEQVRLMGGSISAEHGIGTLKRPFLEYSRSAAELDLMRLIKTALDPSGILNPGKVL